MSSPTLPWRRRRHSLRQTGPPTEWQDGFPLGNGRLGVMLWGDGAPLAFTLDHADLWDLRLNSACLDDPRFTYAGLRQLIRERRFDEARDVFEERLHRDNPVAPTKIYAGRAELCLGKATRYDCTLELERATVRGTVQAGDVEYRLLVFVQRVCNVLCLRLQPKTVAPPLGLVPLADTGPELSKLGLPAAGVRTAAETRVLIQAVPDGNSYAVAWNPVGPDYFLALEVAATPEAAADRAVATWREASDEGFDRLYRQHLSAWREFWSASAVYLPEADVEFLWHHGLYLLACSSRPGSLPPGLQGVWAMDGHLPPWRGDYHADMNVQETFWPAGATGHIELLDSWCDQMKAVLPKVETFTRRFFGTEGTFWPCSFVPDFTWVPCWYTVQFAWSNGGWLGWLVWLRWRYSLDTRWLAGTGYPLLAGIFRFFRANLVQGEDGRLHVPLSTSPEFRENKPEAWAQDPNVDLALIRRACDWLIEMEQALGMNELSSAASDLRQRLPPYTLSADQALCLWPGMPLPESHRHPSHLMAIHPSMDLTVEQGEGARSTIDASVRQFLSLGQYWWAGHTYAQWTSLAAVLGRPGLAYESLRQYADHWVRPNGLHVNRDLRDSGMSGFVAADGVRPPFTMEASCGICMGICDLLLQGWGDVVRVFPAVPPDWRDVGFRDLVAEGAFRVSAVRLDGRTEWVRVMAQVAKTLRLRDPFAGGPYTVQGPLPARDGEHLVTSLSAGEAVVLRRRDACENLAPALRQPRRPRTQTRSRG